MYSKKGEFRGKPKSQTHYEYVRKEENPSSASGIEPSKVNNSGNPKTQKSDQIESKGFSGEGLTKYKENANREEAGNYNSQRGRGFKRGNYPSERGGRGKNYYNSQRNNDYFENSSENYTASYYESKKTNVASSYQAPYDEYETYDQYPEDNYQNRRGGRGGRRRTNGNEVGNRGYKNYGNRNANVNQEKPSGSFSKYEISEQNTATFHENNEQGNFEKYPEHYYKNEKANNHYKKPYQERQSEKTDANKNQRKNEEAQIEERKFNEIENDPKQDEEGKNTTRQKRGKIPLSFKEKKSKTYSDKNDNQFDNEIDEKVLEDKKTGVCRMELLIKSLKSRKLDCPICCQNVKKEQKVWNCASCHHIFHLDCVIRWIETNNQDIIKNKSVKDETKSYFWRCPSCNYSYSEKMPAYFCFCKKTMNPPVESDLLPHSCPEICGKPRGVTCEHPCPNYCHPGPCPPCTMMGKMVECGCGKKKIRVKCGAESKNVTCEEICEKKRNCGLHFCDRLCHQGKCLECEIKIEGLCFCGREKKEVVCGNNEFSCQSVCDHPLGCNKHKCKHLCHKGPCADCPTLPEKIKNCPCGKMTLLTLMGVEQRESCDSPIPVCGGPCKKLLPCKEHFCKRSCHQGECPDCMEQVEQECRCGGSTRKTNCANLYKKDGEKFFCERPCKKKKSCKQHKCFNICCEAKKNDPGGIHLCLNVCGKELSCKNHKCELFCHIGNCQPCPIIINQPINCICGKTSLRPGLPCGTKRPECKFPCSRERPCGHPCTLECHEDDCPPCTYHVDKQCRCGRETIKDVYCSREALCGKACDKMLSCGHTCAEICHIGECLYEGAADGCKKQCGKARKDCGHVCMLPCHPNQECRLEPCKVGVKIQCKCLQRETFVECFGSEDKTLKCDSVCANIQRFGVLRDQENNKKPYFPPLLIKFAKVQNAFLLKLEAQIEEMVKTGKQSRDIPISASDSLKRYALQILLSRHYLMELQFYTNFKNPFVTIKTTTNMVFPKPKLSEYLKKMEKGEIKFDVSPFEITLKFSNLTKSDSLEELENLLKEFCQDYYLERINDKTIYVHFWEKDCAERASKKLKKSLSVFSSHLMESNNKIEQEQNKMEDIVYDIIDKNLEREREEQKVRNLMHEKLKEIQRNKMEFPSLGGAPSKENDDFEEENDCYNYDDDDNN